MAPFVHLHNHSEYSLLDGIARVPDIVTRCQELGFDAYALTDHGVMYGALEFYLKMRAAGLKPLVGCEAYVAPRRHTDKDPQADRHSRHLLLLAMNTAGYVNLMRLTSIAHAKGFYYKPRIDTEVLREMNEGLLMLTGCPGGVVAGAFHHEGELRAREELELYLDIFGEDRVFVEIQDHGLEIEHRYKQWAMEQANRLGLPIVATNDCHYVYKEDAQAHDIALCLRDKKLLTDTDRLKYSGPDYYIKSEEEMREVFADVPQAIDNTLLVADKCDLELDLESVHFPRFTIPLEEAQRLKHWAGENPQDAAGPEPEMPAAQLIGEALAGAEGEIASTGGQDALFEAYLRQLTYEGAIKRYGGVSEDLRQRIEYELSIIIPKGFTTYFLVCADFCRFARDNNIPVGPGRGSAAGSVVAYCLEITDLDPIRYGLYFERFLNPERIELPDFDIDFCVNRRDEVIGHVRRKYGDSKVAMIVTFNRLKARAVIKAVGRTKGLEYQYTDKVTKEIHGLNVSIEDAINGNPALREMVRGDETIGQLVADSRRLEGVASHHGVHAAGLVIGPRELWHYVPTQPHKDTELLVTQYAMDTVPLTGLVKFDFLGLRNLTMIQDTVDYIRDIEGVEVDPRTIPDDDPDTYAMLQRGDAYGVFQFEAAQVKRMLIEGRPSTIIDLAAINAANRPGPIQSGNTELYLKNRKRGVTGHAQYKLVEEILAPTGGVLLFQEQVMEIARKLGGFSLGEADVLRKAMGKKKFDLMEELKKKFLKGVQERGLDVSQATAVWEVMEKFAGYGFNKAHSTCYAWIAYQTAYLKCHYPQYFMAAMLNSFVGSSDRLAQILSQCRQMRIDVRPPSVNDSGFRFTPTRDGAILFGLGGIKGIGEGPVEAIRTERDAAGPFKSLEGFYQRMKGRLNKKVLQSLAMAGAFDCLGVDRLELVSNLDDIESFIKGPDNQISLFGEEDGPQAGVLPSKEVTPLDVAMLEKQAIGLFLTNHPFADHEMYRDKRYMQLADFETSVLSNHTQWVDRALPSMGLAGLLTNVVVRHANTSNRQYAKARLEDPERSVAVMIWPRAYDKAREIIAENSPVVLWGKVQIPETAEEAEGAWAELELVVERVERYDPAGGRFEDKGTTDRMGGGNGLDHLQDSGGFKTWEDVPAGSAAAGGGHGAGQGEEQVEEDDSITDFAPLSMKPIEIGVDLSRASFSQVERFAHALESAEGEQEVRLLLKGVSRQLTKVKVNRRFYTNLDVARQLEEEFPFIATAGS